MVVPTECDNVLVRDQPYMRMSSNAYFRAYYSPVRASDLSKFQVTYQGFYEFCTNTTSPSPNIKFGSIVADHKLLTGSLADKSTDDMKEIFESAFVMNEEQLPELYINRSLRIQLKEYFKEYNINVDSQSASFLTKDEHNLYHTSLPDIMFWMNDAGPVVHARESASDDEAEGDGNDQIEAGRFEAGCGELKKGTGGKYQLYGESFNVAVSYASQQIKMAKPFNEVVVYCWLLIRECKFGLISKMTINFRDRKCIIEEDKTEYSVDKCVQILADCLRKKQN